MAEKIGENQLNYINISIPVPNSFQALAGAGILVCILLLAGCASVVVPGTIAGAGEYYHYNTDNVAKRTLTGDINEVTTATKRALEKMDMHLQSVTAGNSETTIKATTAELEIDIEIEAITSTSTKVSVNAVEDYVVKDKATAAEILSQIRIELDKQNQPQNHAARVYIKNDCDHTIDIAVYCLAETDTLKTWQTRGWFSLVPGQKKHVADTRNRYIYFYGKTRSEDLIRWAGEYVHRFEGNRYGFFRVDIGTVLGDYTQSFRCSQK